MPRAPKHCPPKRRRSPSSVAADDPVERRRRAEAVAAWVAVRGWWCPGFQREPHPARDLTAAHSRAVGLGGKDSEVGVLCRSCNSRQRMAGGLPDMGSLLR